jgi:hypothetical protein
MMVADAVSEASEVYSMSTQLPARGYFVVELELHLFLNNSDSLKSIFSDVSILGKYRICL